MESRGVIYNSISGLPSERRIRASLAYAQAGHKVDKGDKGDKVCCITLLRVMLGTYNISIVKLTH